MAATDRWVVAVDQGTSATKALLVDAGGAVVSQASVRLEQDHPRPGWSEQDGVQLWTSAQRAVAKCLRGRDARKVVAIGLSTQRESTLLWERSTGRPLGPMLGWQDTRNSDLCTKLRAEGHDERIRLLTGLPLDPMFSASKATWLLDQHDPDRSRSLAGTLCLGTVDSWLLWNLTGRHVIECGNAARTQLLDIDSLDWDPWLLKLYGIPTECLPRVLPSSGPFPSTHGLGPVPSGVPVGGVLGDSHAALFAHGARKPGQVKVTYGTGSSVMGLTDDRTPATDSTMARTIAWVTDAPAYALEGNIRATGATLVWLANLLGSTPGQLAAAAADDSGGVVLVPAFTGLGAPWWDDQARAVMLGFTEGTRAPHAARAALESIAFQIEDVVAEVERQAGTVDTIFADGGPTENPKLMQLQADLSGRQVDRAVTRDLSALGAAHLAGLSAGVWTAARLHELPRPYEHYRSQQDADYRTAHFAAWHHAVDAARSATARSSGRST